VYTSAESAFQFELVDRIRGGSESRFQPRKLSGLPQAADERAPLALNAAFLSKNIPDIPVTCHAEASAKADPWSSKIFHFF
jgi:hypothetical protein